MSHADHTPGPWRHDIACIWGDDDASRDGYPIARVASFRDSSRSQLADLANADLMASAPELLAFSKWSVDQFCGGSGTGESHWEQFPEFAAGLKAIAKAEGRAA